MRRIMGLGVALFLLSLTLAVAHAQEALTQTYTTSDGSFSIMLPADWKVTDNSTEPPSVLAQTPVGPQAIVSLGLIPLSGSLKDTLDQSLGSYFPSNAIEYTDTQFGSYPGLHGQYVQSAQVGVDIYAMDIGNGNAFVSAILASSADIKTLSPTLPAVMASFKPGTKSGSSATEAAEAPTTAGTTVPMLDAASMPAAPAGTQSEIIYEGSDEGGGVADATFMIDLAGNVTQITHTNDAAALQLLTLSPDGKSLAFVSFDPAGNDRDLHLYLVDPNGDNMRRLTLSQPDIRAVAWSPDSSQLLYAVAYPAFGGQVGIYKINADGSNETKLPLDGIDLTKLEYPLLDWSPDGKRIAFAAAAQGTTDLGLFFADADGGNVTPGPKLNISHGSVLFRWSPDGQHALFTDFMSLTVMNADGSDPKQVVAYGEGLSIPGIAWSPDSQHILFDAYKYPDFAPVWLYILNADGSNRQQLDTSQQAVIDSGGPVSWGNIPTDLLRSDAVGSTASGADTTASGADTTATVASPVATPEVSEPTDTGAAASVTCSVAAKGTANLRSGPGTSFAKAGSLAAGAGQSASGQATGSDGNVWYQLEGNQWVRSDLVTPSGDCASLPTVSP